MFQFEGLFHPGQPDVRRAFPDFVTTHGDRRYPYSKSAAPFGRRINASSGEPPGWSDWPAAEARFLEAMCVDLMARYGYGTEPGWRAKVDDARAATGGAD